MNGLLTSILFTSTNINNKNKMILNIQLAV